MNSRLVRLLRAPRSALLVFLAVGTASADIRLPAIIGDHMVMQQSTKAALWGWADPGESIEVRASWSPEPETVMTGDNGKWKVNLQTPAAGGPYTITLAGKNEITLTDVLIGEVWLCSGQSNMQMPLKHPTPGYDVPVLNHEEEIRNANHPEIRLFLVPYTAVDEPQDVGKGEWKRCSPESV